ncbi:insulin-degrading enzyme-like [Arctopsyche grandis]|uniref:insulin-degrading enzyme-like n=1 Tax=Arctopsyche grandis TaxID=121162 RepID=UPI00406D7275
MSVEQERVVERDVGEDVIYRWDNIIKSSGDKREYRGIQLKNRLKVLLVSDPTTDKSAAALNVNVGHLSDPDSVPGLAHFCEHMLFLGTKKYPEENMYMKFLSDNGGNANAWTSSDATTYFFGVLPEHFAAALDLFAQFFISPLFTVSATDRELQAVNAEHESYLWDDFWRFDQLHKSTIDPNHPFHKFGVGNRDTLETTPKEMDIDVRQELLKFHSKWYSANLMNSVIFGKESLDDLEEMVIEKFSEIEDNDTEIPSWPQHPYSEDYQGLQINTVPVKDVRYLFIDFPIPDTRIHYKSDPTHYISHLIGHEGPGSLLSLLKAKGWCNSLSSYSYCGGRGFAIYKIYVDLTENGINHIDDIVELVFQYINLLNKEGIQKWIFEEIANIHLTKFKFQDKKEPKDFVTRHVYYIQDYPMEEIMSARFHLTEWKPELIQEFLSMLTPERIRITVVGKIFESICDQSEQWYGTKYHLEKISKEKLDRWNKCGLNEGLHLPAVNAFLPDNLDVIEPDPESKEYPTIVYDTPLMRVWYKQDDEYFLPKMNTFFEFVSPISNSDPLNYSLNSLFISLLEDSLNEHTHAAGLAGINYYIYDNENGFSIQTYGYNSKQHVLLNCIMDKLTSFRANPERFAILKENYIRELNNFEAKQPRHHSFFYLDMMLSEVSWSKKECLNIEYALTIDNLHDFINNLLRKIHVECLVHGNASKKKTIEIASIVEQKLSKNLIPLLPQHLTLMREIRLEEGSHYRLEVNHTVYRCSCTLLYFQCGLQTTIDNVLLDLLLHVLFEPSFNVLRTKEQLGYAVFSGIRRSNGVQGIRILVQSDKHPNYVESRIEAFLQYMDDYINKLSDQEYKNHRDSLIAEKLERPKKMLDRSYIFISEILSQQYHFDRVNVDVKVLQEVTKKQLYDFYKNILSISSPNRQKLGVHIISSAEGGAGHPDTIIDTAESENPNSELLPVPEDPLKMVKIDDVVTFKSNRPLFQLISPYTNIPRKGVHILDSVDL